MSDYELRRIQSTVVLNPPPNHQERVVMLLEGIWEELINIRQAMATEVVEDSDSDPFQTLNGP